jgi:hypothetical protein
MKNKNTLPGLNIVGSKRSDGTDREINDYYATDPIAIDCLFKKIKPQFQNDIIWEPCVGEGNLSNRIRDYGYNNVIESDIIIDRPNSPKNIIEYDFLTPVVFQNDKIPYKDVQWIITNPPYNYAMECITQGMEYLDMYSPVKENNPKRICFILKTTFLESQSRFDFFTQNKLFSDLFVFSKRLGCYKNNIKTGSGIVSYSWFIFTQGYEGKPKIDWVKY